MLKIEKLQFDDTILVEVGRTTVTVSISISTIKFVQN